MVRQRHHLLGGIIKCSVRHWGLLGQVWGRKSLLVASPNEVGIHGCHPLLEGFVDALRLLPLRHSPESLLTVYLRVFHSTLRIGLPCLS